MAEQPTDPPAVGRNVQPHVVNNLILLHISEYQALTNRNTYWTTIQLTLWMIILVYISLVVSMSTAKPSYQATMLWGSGVVIQIILAGWYFAGQEIYRNVNYLEHYLRSLIQDLVGDEPFWQYERFLATKSNKWPLWTDIGPTIGFLAAFAGAVWIRHALTNREVIGVLLNLPFTINLVWQTREMVAQRRALAVGGWSR